MDLEKCSVAPVGQERCQSERERRSRSRSQLEEDGKMKGVGGNTEDES